MNKKRVSLSTNDVDFEPISTSLDEITKVLGITSLNVNQTINLFEKSLEAGILKGRSKHLVMMSSLYVVCRQSNIPLSLHEIASAGRIQVKNLARCVRILIHSLDLYCGPYDYSTIVDRISNSLKLREELRRDAINFLIKANEKGMCVGKRPLTIAAAVVYISCKINKEHKPLWKISEVSGIHNVTIRNNAQSISRLLNVE